MNQYYKSSFSDNVFNILSQELNIQGNICEIIDNCFEITNKIRKTFETENDSQFKDYRDINNEERTKFYNDKLSKLPIHDKVKKRDLDNVMMDFDATSLYPSAMYDGKSV